MSSEIVDAEVAPTEVAPTEKSRELSFSPIVDNVRHSPDDDRSAVASEGSAEDPEDQDIPADDPIYDEEKMQAILDEVEFCFSDENIAKNAFMYKHIKRNKEGWVNIKLVSCFRKIRSKAGPRKSLVVAEAVRRSTKLRLNETATKIARIEPVPDDIAPVTRAVDEAARTVLAYQIADPQVNMTQLEHSFSRFGLINKIVIYRNADDAPNELRQQLYKMRLLQNDISSLVPMAVIQFSNPEEAKLAAEQMAEQEAMKVEVVPPVSAKKAAKEKARQKAEAEKVVPKSNIHVHALPKTWDHRAAHDLYAARGNARWTNPGMDFGAPPAPGSNPRRCRHTAVSVTTPRWSSHLTRSAGSIANPTSRDVCCSTIRLPIVSPPDQHSERGDSCDARPYRPRATRTRSSGSC